MESKKHFAQSYGVSLGNHGSTYLKYPQQPQNGIKVEEQSVDLERDTSYIDASYKKSDEMHRKLYPESYQKMSNLKAQSVSPKRAAAGAPSMLP